MTLANATNQLFGVLTVIAQLLSLVLLVCVIARNRIQSSRISGWIGNHAITLAFVVALTATLGSLWYSEVLKYDPCKLCWLQRIFMYPQALLFGIALWQKDKEMLLYGMIFSAIGGLIAGYHYLLQLGVVPEGSCSTVGYSVSCAKRFVMQFGYITLPLMALSAFLLILLICIAGRRFAGSLK